MPVDAEPDPPRRPRRFEVDAVLVVIAMVLLGALVVVQLDWYQWEGIPPWLSALLWDHWGETIYDWCPSAAIALLALSLVVRWRRRPAR